MFGIPFLLPSSQKKVTYGVMGFVRAKFRPIDLPRKLPLPLWIEHPRERVVKLHLAQTKISQVLKFRVSWRNVIPNHG